MRELGRLMRTRHAISAGVLLLAALPASCGVGLGDATRRGRERGATPAPDARNVRYGPHERNVLDLWKAKVDRPAPLVVYIHGGAFSGGDKSQLGAPLLKICLQAGISVASINYRLSQQAAYPAPMMDAARAIQFVRYRAKEFNIDPDKIAAMGKSAGGGMSLWLALHDDLADPQSDDPVARQSTRLACAVGLAAQSSYDPRFIERHISARTAAHPGLLALFGLSADQLDTDRAHELFEAASPINHVTPDDPPVFLLYNAPKELPDETTPAAAGIHHPKFGELLNKRMKTVDVECVLRHRSDYAARGSRQAYAEIIAFLKRHFGETAS